MRKAKCFAEIIKSSGVYTVIDEGLRVIRVEQIIGTVDKCGELSSDFQYIKRFDKGERFRRREIEAKTGTNFFFAPIQVNKYNKRYFVIDGHRRTAAAKVKDIEYIDAYVSTYIAESDSETRLGINARKLFEQKTGITTIRLTEELRFDELLEDIKNYCGGETDNESALQWKTERFLPGCRAIENSNLPHIYPNLEAGDVYALLYQFYADYFGGFPDGAGFESLIASYYASRFPGKNRPFRSFPFRFLFNIITRNAGKKMV